MAVLKFQAYNGNDVNGTALGELTDAYEKVVGLEDNAVGNGSFSIHPDSSQVGWCAQGNYVKVWRDTISGAAIAGFWIETGGDTLLSEDEVGGRAYKRSGRGPIAILREAIVWHRAVSGSFTEVVQRDKGRWLWKNAHPARPLVRLLEEAKARGAIQDVTWDFTRKRDSNGTLWPDEDERFSVPIGMDLLSLVGELREADLHITMSPDLVLSAVPYATNDLSATIKFVAGTDIREASEREIAAQRAVSSILVQGTNRKDVTRYRASFNQTIRTALGRRKEGYFAYPRTATVARLSKVGQRKLRKWKKQHDGPFTLGTLDKVNQVALVDFTVGDTVEVDIPGQYDNVDERIAGITLVEQDNGEYDPIIDFGDFAHDPVTGQYFGGDRGGLSPCGCEPGGGGGGGGTTESPPPGAPGTTPTNPDWYDFDDFDRITSLMSLDRSNSRTPVTPEFVTNGGAIHTLDLPRQPTSTDYGVMFATFTSQEDGSPADKSYSTLVGQAPYIVGGLDNMTSFDQTSTTADDIDIPMPDGIQVGDVIVFCIIHYTTGSGIGNYWDWTNNIPDMHQSGTGHGGTPSGNGTMFAFRVTQALYDSLGFSGVNDVLNTSLSEANNVTVDQTWAHAWLMRGVVNLWSPDDPTDFRWNGGPTTSESIGSLDPTAGYTNWVDNDIAMWWSMAAADEAISGEHDHYGQVASGSNTGLPFASEAHYVISMHYDDSNTQSPSPDRTFDAGGNELQVLFAIGGGIGWTYGDLSGNNAYMPATSWYRNFTANDDYSDEQELHIVFVDTDPGAGTHWDGVTATEYATFIIDGAVGFVKGSDWLNGGPGPAGNYNVIDDTDAGAAVDNLFLVYGGRGGKQGAMTGDIRRWIASPPTDLGETFPEFDVVKLIPSRTTDGVPANAVAVHRTATQVHEPALNQYYAWEDAPPANDTTYGDGQTLVYALRGGALGSTGSADGSGIGAILTSAQNGGSPWAGGNYWSYNYQTNVSAFGISNGHLYGESNSTSLNKWQVEVRDTEGLEPVPLPFQTDEWEMEVRWRLSGAVGSTTDAGDRYCEFDWMYSGNAKIWFGDTTHDEGISTTGELAETYKAKDLPTLGEYGRLKWTWTGGRVKAKMWPESETEPAAWDVEDNINPTAEYEDGTDFALNIQCELGNNGGTAQKFEIDWIRVRLLAGSGTSVVDGFVAYGDNVTTKFFIGAFEPGTLTVKVDGFPTVPVEVNPEQGWFRLDRAPYGDPSDEGGSSIVTASWESSA